MRLENLLALTQGQLIGEPSVSLFDAIAFDPRKVKRGSLFIAYNPDDIPEALANGAYGVLFEKPTQIGDPEIAWIKVESIDEALIKLLRFHILDKKIIAYACDPITLHLSSIVDTRDKIHKVEGSMQEIWDALWPLDSMAIVLFSPSLISPDLFVEYRPLEAASTKKIEIIEQTLFETSFIYADIFYERQMLSPFFIPYLEHLLHFYDKLSLEYQLKNFSKIGHFIPLFMNKRLEVKDFGSSERVVIFEPYLEFIEEQTSFLNEQATWAKIIYILPDRLRNEKSESVENIFFYRYPEEIVLMLQAKDFHFALVGGVDKTILKPTRSTMTQLELDLF